MSDDPQGEVEIGSIADKLRVILQSAANNTVCVLDGHKLLAEFSKPEIAAMRKALSEPPQAALRPSAGAGEIEALRTAFCAPGDDPHDWWILRFNDNEVGDSTWGGDAYGPGEAEALARAAFAQYSPSWNCYLFRLASLTAPAPGVQTEALCDDCGGVNPVWFAPNPLWNLVMGGPDCIADPGGFICPRCFIVRAQALNDFAGVGWKLVPESETDWAEAERIQALMRSPAPGVCEAMEEADLGFMPPLRFEFAQSSDQSGEHYTSLARFVDAKGHVIIDITPNGDWVDTQMHFIADLLTRARLSSLPAAGETR